MILLAALSVGALVLLLLLPENPMGPSAGVAYLAGQVESGPQGWFGKMEARQRALMQGTGLTIDPRVLLLIQFGIGVAVGVFMFTVLGVISAVLGGVAVMLFFREAFATLRERRLQLFAVQFRDALTSLTQSLRAGQSLPTALETCVHDLRRLLGKGDAPVIEQLQQVVEEVRLGVSVDQALEHLKQRVPTEEVAHFVDAAVITRNKGGNLAEVMTGVAKLITDKLAVRQEVQVLTAEKRAEGLVVSILPVIVLVLILVMNPKYMAPLTDTFWGQALIGAGLFAVVGSYLISRSITRIEV